MKSRPKIGAAATEEFVVGPQHAIEFSDSELPAVLSTPSLVGLLERLSRQAIAPFLEAGETSVGMEVELEHLAPTPLGGRVRCETRVVRTEANQVWFQITARDETELVAKGFHKRAVIDKGRFARRVQKKQAGRG